MPGKISSRGVTETGGSVPDGYRPVPATPRVYVVSDVRLYRDGLVASLARQSELDVLGAGYGARVVNRDALTEILNARFTDEDGHELTRRMLAAGLPAGPLLNIDEAMAADHTAHRKMVTELGAYRGLGTPIKLSRTPGGTRSTPPRFNEHGEAVLRAHGFSDAEIAALAREGVLVPKRRR